ncbi:MAG: methyltransferase domain-containing protein [Actinomycetota bacterium]
MSASEIDPKQIVEAGYNAVADRYAEWSQNEIKGSPAVEYLEKLISMLPGGAAVLELGCGNGEPAARMLAPGRQYTGVDLSAEQLRRAQELVPSGAFVKGDYTKLVFPPSSTDAVVALYTLTHVPRAELAGLVARVASWLYPGGHLLATTVSRESVDGVYDWLGVPMFFSGMAADASLNLIAEAGLEVLEHEIVCQDEGEEGKPCFLWVLARRPE